MSDVVEYRLKAITPLGTFYTNYGVEQDDNGNNIDAESYKNSIHGQILDALDVGGCMSFIDTNGNDVLLVTGLIYRSVFIVEKKPV